MTIFNETMSDGSLIDGEAIVSLVSQESGIDGSLIDGLSSLSVESSYVMEDGVLLNGSSLLSVNFDEYGESGVELDGSYSAVVSLSVDLFTNYSINNEIDVDASFFYSVGELPLYWWQIEGYVWPPDDTRCLGITPSTERQNFIQTILARTPKEVCEYFDRENRNWQIVSVKRFTQPADAFLADQTDNCNQLYQINAICPNFTISNRPLIQIGAKVRVSQLFKRYTGSGGATFYGQADASIISGGVTPTASSYSYASSGFVVTTGGSADSESSFDVSYVTYGGVKVLLDEYILFGLGTAPLLPVPADLVETACGTCIAFPLNLYIEDNLENPSIFANFLRRNAFEMPDLMKVSYSNRLEFWSQSQHFTGLSTDSSAEELWRVQYEFGCTSNYDGETGSYPLLKFSILITKKNLTTNATSDTKVLVYLPPEQVCNIIRNFSQDLIFQVNVRTQNLTNINNITAESVLIMDNIGIFSSTYWASNPNLEIRITAIDTTTTVNTVDIFPIFPTNPVVFSGEEGLIALV
jgi:hypothetical protein